MIFKLIKKITELIITSILSMGFLFLQMQPFMGRYHIATIKGSEAGFVFFEDAPGHLTRVERVHEPHRPGPGVNLEGILRFIRDLFLCSQNYYALPRFALNDRESSFSDLLSRDYILYTPARHENYYIFSKINVWAGFFINLLINFAIFCATYFIIRAVLSLLLFIIRAALRPLSPTKYQRSLLTQPSLKRPFENQAIRLKKRAQPKKDKA